MIKMKWTKEEMQSALNGAIDRDDDTKNVGSGIVRDRYILEFTPEWLNKLACDELISNYPEGMSFDDMAVILDVTQSAIEKTLDRAKKRLRDSGQFLRLVRLVSLLRELHYHGGSSGLDKEFKVSTKITIVN
jgi:predicted DNA-binding protein YlxM (UPF0122 family)